MLSKKEYLIPSAFIWRRVHSLLGLWIVIYLVEHLLTNSQAALWLGEDGRGFINIVNVIHGLPFLQVIELTLIGLPIAFHAAWGIKYALTAKFNSRKSDGSKPSLGYGRNRAYTWQRLSSWILLVGIILHVIQMRFIDKPKEAMRNNQKQYFVKISLDEGLYTLAPRLGVSLYGAEEVEKFREEGKEATPFMLTVPSSDAISFHQQLKEELEEEQDRNEQIQWKRTIGSYQLSDWETVAVSNDIATAMLLHVRDTFKSIWMDIIYTIFVLAAAFHAGNGLWTFAISWGLILSYRSQKKMVNYSLAFAGLLLFLGLASIWGSYWFNLRD